MTLMINFPFGPFLFAVGILTSPFTGSAGSSAITTETVSFKSSALDQITSYVVALPSPLQKGMLYPTIYLLHGATGSHMDWTEQSTFTQLLKDRDLIVVMPEGGSFGWYLDSKLQSGSQYQTAIVRDLITDVEARFPVAKSRNKRGIAGLSMGGHGALSLAAKNPQLFGSASSMSGILDISAHPGKWNLDELLGTQPEHLDEWKLHSVYCLAEAYTTAGVALLFDTGVSDKTGAVEDNRRLNEKLTRLNIPHVYREYPGDHNWAYWNARIEEHLDFHQGQFNAARKP